MGDDPTISPFEALVSATALDVSRQGMQVKSEYNVPVGSYVSAILYFQGRQSICLCEVVWRREEIGDFFYGLYFKEWTQLDRLLEARFHSLEVPPTAGPLLAIA